MMVAVVVGVRMAWVVVRLWARALTLAAVTRKELTMLMGTRREAMKKI
jgi:hypothetical protein